MIKKSLISLLLLVLLISCEKEIDVKLEEVKPKLVVEGAIENGEFAYVALSKSTPYFAPVDTNTFSKMFIKDALVIVSDGVIFDTLQYDTVPFYPPFRFQGSKIKGDFNHTYDLRIEYQNEIYQAQTRILEPINIDSVKYQYYQKSDSLGFLRFYANNPSNQVNYYRIFLMDLKFDFTKEIPIWLHPSRSVWDDTFISGKLMESDLYKARNPLKPASYYEEHTEDWWAFKMGDEYWIKLSQIDYASFNFWKTTEQVISNTGNPFSSPTTVQANIQPNALGIWCGYASSIYHVNVTEDIILEE